jgi:predicted transcriptional regulator of viral defense system
MKATHETEPRSIEQARRIFETQGGILRTSEALAMGIHPSTLYTMRDAGVLESLSRGLFRLADLPVPDNQDLISIALRIPKARICLISALAFHNITTQIPHEVHCALPRDVHSPRLDYPPIRIYRFSNTSYDQGVETHKLSGISVPVYNEEKTLADCFKFRNQVGMDTVLEALKLYRERKPLRVDKLLSYAKTCRVERIMSPYLEATL